MAGLRSDAHAVNFLYYERDGGVYGCQIIDQWYFGPEHLIHQGGWNGDLSCSGGYIYRLQGGQIWRHHIDQPFSFGPGELLASGLPGNAKFSVAKEYIYYMPGDGNLYAQPVSGGNAEMISGGGWSGKIAAQDGYAYRVDGNRLYIYRVEGMRVWPVGQADRPRNGELAFVANNDVLYRVEDGKLLGNPINGAQVSPERQLQFQPISGDRNPAPPTDWVSSIAAVIWGDGSTPPPPVSWIQEIEQHYMDRYGFVSDARDPDQNPWGIGNALLWTSWYYIVRKVRGEWDSSTLEQFHQTIRQVQVVPGLFRRHPSPGWRDQYTAWDDYVGLALASYVCDPDATVANQILDYGQNHAFYYGGQPIGIERPWIPAYLAVAAHQPALVLDPLSIFPASLTAFTLDLTASKPALCGYPDQTCWYTGWEEAQIADMLPIPLDEFQRRFMAKWPAGMADVLRGWGTNEHPHPLVEVFPKDFLITRIPGVVAFVQPPPVDGWDTMDIGPGLPGSFTVNPDGSWTLKGSGADIWGQADAFRYAYTQMRGDFSVTCRVTSQTNTDPWAKVGVMIRDGLQPGSRQLMLIRTPGWGVNLQWRSVTDGDSSAAGNNLYPGNLPIWLQVQRRGGGFTAFVSRDGTNWDQAGPTITISMNDQVYAGVAITAHNASRTCVANVDHVSVSTGVSPPASTGVPIPVPAAPVPGR